MLRAINRGDDIYIASPINSKALYNNDKLTGFDYGSYNSRELYEMVKKNIKPKNITQTECINTRYYKGCINKYSII